MTTKSEMSAWDKVLQALSTKERLWLRVSIIVGVAFLTLLLGIAIGKATTNTPTIIAGEIKTLVAGNGDNLYTITNTQYKINPTEKVTLLSSDESYIIYKELTIRVADFCPENNDQLLLQVWMENNPDEIWEFCAKPDSYIIASEIGTTYWDGEQVNGFTDNWKQFRLPPSLFRESPELTPTP